MPLLVLFNGKNVIDACSGCASISLGLGPLIFGASKDLFSRCGLTLTSLESLKLSYSHLCFCLLNVCSYTPVLVLTGSGLLITTLVQIFTRSLVS